MPATTGHSSRTGATLVEILVALGIAVMIMAVVILAHHTLTMNSSGQAKRLKQADRALATISELRNDLLQLYAPGGDSTCSVELENRDDQLVRLSFCRWEASKGRGLILTNRLEKISYLIDESGESPRLLRLIQSTTGPGSDQPYVTNWIDSAWTRLVIQFSDGSTWKSKWPENTGNTGAPPSIPLAARIQLLSESDSGRPDATPAYEATVIIPVAMTVTSSIVRANGSIVP